MSVKTPGNASPDILTLSRPVRPNDGEIENTPGYYQSYYLSPAKCNEIEVSKIIFILDSCYKQHTLQIQYIFIYKYQQFSSRFKQ